MLSVNEVVRRSEDFLRQKGVPEPRLDAEHLVADALALRRLDLYLQWERPLVEAELEQIRLRVRRRAGREPLQHILGHVPFHDLKLKCDRRALIPRPETEELAEILIARLKDRPPARVADLGTGSGALALALAAAFPAAAVVATDRSPQALELARENALACGLAGRVEFVCTHWLQGVPGPFDLIVANPPYLSASEVAAAEPEVRLFEPPEALVAASDGLADLGELLATSGPHLAPGGLLALETGISHHPRLLQAAQATGWTHTLSLRDACGRGNPRFFLAWREGGTA